MTPDLRTITTMDATGARAIYDTYKAMALPTLRRQRIMIERKRGRSERRLTDNREMAMPDKTVEAHCQANLKVTFDLLTLIDAADEGHSWYFVMGPDMWAEHNLTRVVAFGANQSEALRRACIGTGLVRRLGTSSYICDPDLARKCGCVVIDEDVEI